MKLRNLIALFIAAALISSCTQEKPIDPDVKFSVRSGDGRPLSDVKAQLPILNEKGEVIGSKDVDAKLVSLGSPIWVYSKKGSAEFRTVFTGVTYSKYGDLASTGTSFGTADSLSVTYNEAGVFSFVFVASSAGNQGNDFLRKVDSMYVKVIDQRAEFNSFTLNGGDEPVTGTIIENTITGEAFDYPGRDYSKFVPTFGTTSNGAKVYLNEVSEANLQTKGVSKVDFTNATSTTPLKYIVVSPNGEQTIYNVWLKKLDPPDEHELSFIQVLAGGVPSETATPVGTALDLVCNNVNITESRGYGLKVVASTGAKVEILLNDKWEEFSEKKNYKLFEIKGFRVTAQDQKPEHVTEYEVRVYDKLLTSFSFAGDLIPAYPGVVDLAAKTITFTLNKEAFTTKPEKEEGETKEPVALIEKLVPSWKGSATKVMVGEVEQVNGVTVQDFSKSQTKTYTFYAGNTTFEFEVIIILE